MTKAVAKAVATSFTALSFGAGIVALALTNHVEFIFPVAMFGAVTTIVVVSWF